MLETLCLGCNLAWGSVPDQLVAATAAISAWLVVRQLGGLRADRERADATLNRQLEQFRSEANTARANLLLRIDEQFEAGSVLRSRNRWLALRAEFRRGHATLTDPAIPREIYVREQMAQKLNGLWDQVQNHGVGATSFASDLHDYSVIVRLPNWIETIAMMGRDGYLPVSDLVRLYGSVIRSTMNVVADHVAYRRRDVSASPSVFEHGLWLHAQLPTA